MEAPPPVALPAAPVKDASSGATRAKHLRKAQPVFLTSFGDLTLYDAVGGKRWQRRTAATWANAEGELHGDRVEPTLALLPMRTHAVPTAILAAGVLLGSLFVRQGSCMEAARELAQSLCECSDLPNGIEWFRMDSVALSCEIGCKCA